MYSSEESRASVRRRGHALPMSKWTCSMNCGGCGLLNGERATYCKKCGRRLSKDVRIIRSQESDRRASLGVLPRNIAKPNSPARQLSQEPPRKRLFQRLKQTCAIAMAVLTVAAIAYQFRPEISIEPSVYLNAKQPFSVVWNLSNSSYFDLLKGCWNFLRVQKSN
jgi:hypothetical protein